MPSYVIAGASRGIGYEYLRILSADQSNTVVGLVRNIANTEDSVKKEGWKNVYVVPGDLTDYKSMYAAADEVSEITDGKVDYLVINGAFISKQSADMAPTAFIGKEEFLKKDAAMSFETNFVGPVFAINAFLPLVKNGSVKKIIVVSSGMADTELVRSAGVAEALTYSASKSAANVLVAKYSVELKKFGITIIAMSPGLVDTSEGKKPTPEEMAKYQLIANQLKTYAPNFTGPISTEQSVKAQLSVIGNITIEQSGDMISHLGNKQWL
ncbi:hypothetical protein V1506DRAFT_548159 [Lipomyces tetrasporus]